MANADATAMYQLVDYCFLFSSSCCQHFSLASFAIAISHFIIVLLSLLLRCLSLVCYIVVHVVFIIIVKAIFCVLVITVIYDSSLVITIIVIAIVADGCWSLLPSL